MSLSVEQRYSELPAEALSSAPYNQRASELPTGAAQVAVELESPRTHPRPLQSVSVHGTANQKQESQGLGLSIDERTRN
jgi:hypothetical protein